MNSRFQKFSDSLFISFSLFRDKEKKRSKEKENAKDWRLFRDAMCY